LEDHLPGSLIASFGLFVSETILCDVMAALWFDASWKAGHLAHEHNLKWNFTQY